MKLPGFLFVYIPRFKPLRPGRYIFVKGEPHAGGSTASGFRREDRRC